MKLGMPAGVGLLFVVLAVVACDTDDDVARVGRAESAVSAALASLDLLEKLTELENPLATVTASEGGVEVRDGEANLLVDLAAGVTSGDCAGGGAMTVECAGQDVSSRFDFAFDACRGGSGVGALTLSGLQETLQSGAGDCAELAADQGSTVVWRDLVLSRADAAGGLRERQELTGELLRSGPAGDSGAGEGGGAGAAVELPSARFTGSLAALDVPAALDFEAELDDFLLELVRDPDGAPRFAQGTGDFLYDDARAGKRFEVRMSGLRLTVTPTEAEGEPARSLELAGSCRLACVGDIEVATLEPLIIIADESDCAVSGCLELRLSATPGERHELRFSDGELLLDVDGNGSIDRRYAGCRETNVSTPCFAPE